MSFFGLDIGSNKIKIAQVEKSGSRARLVAFGSAITPPRALLSESESDVLALGEAIKKLYLETGISTKSVVVALPEDRVFVKVVTFPKLSEKELESAIKWEAEQYIPVPLDEVNLDFQIVGESKSETGENMDILLAAAPKLLIEKIVKATRLAGLQPISLEPEVLALARSLTMDAETYLLVDLGARTTDLAVVENHAVVLAHSLPTAGDSLTRTISSDLKVDFSQAEEYKKAYGANADVLEGKVKDSILPALEAITREIEKAIRFYETSRKKSIRRIVLAGGSAALPGIVSVLAQSLSLEIQIGNPFASLDKNQSIESKIPADAIPLYATAIGLALKDVS